MPPASAALPRRRVLFFASLLSGHAVAAEVETEFEKTMAALHPNGRAAAKRALQLGERPQALAMVRTIGPGDPHDYPVLVFNSTARIARHVTPRGSATYRSFV